MAVSRELLDRFRKVDPATVGHFISGGFMHPGMKPLNRKMKLVGPACTVQLVGKDSAPLYYAIEHGEPGSVLVVDRCGDTTYACVGEIVALYARKRGFAGIVIDGPATDSRALEVFDFPVFCTGISVVTTNVLGLGGAWNKDIPCAGASVRPGDIILGDADGVIVLPEEGCEAVLTRAEQAQAREPEVKKYVEETGHIRLDIDRLWETDVVGLINGLKKFGQ